MINKYFTVEVKPIVQADDNGMSDESAANDDVLFDWTPFEVPKGSSRLLGATVRVAGTDGVKQESALQLFFAKSANYAGVLDNKPITIGGWSAVPVTVPSKNEHLGSLKIETIDYMCQSTPGMSVGSTGNSVAANGSNVDMVLTPLRNPADYYYNGTTKVPLSPGADVLWVCGMACAEFDFASTVTSDGALAAGYKTLHTDVKNANLVFSPGDVIQELDNTVIGTITSISSPTGTDCDIFLEENAVNPIADGVVIYHRHPITMELSFEK
tara:strand:- start:27 stop:833 length:807 start_codon:yes stop_codon:yes gene_type:complete